MLVDDPCSSGPAMNYTPRILSCGGFHFQAPLLIPLPAVKHDNYTSIVM